MKDARGVSDLALMLNDESTPTQVEDLLRPQRNATIASKKVIEGGRQSKREDEEKNLLPILKYQRNPSVPTRRMEVRH